MDTSRNERVLRELYEIILFAWKCMTEMGVQADADKRDKCMAKWGDFQFTRYPDMWNVDSDDADLVQFSNDIGFTINRFYAMRSHRNEQANNV